MWKPSSTWLVASLALFSLCLLTGRGPAVSGSPVAAADSEAWVIDEFHDQAYNKLGFWHGGDLGLEWIVGPDQVKLTGGDSEQPFYTRLAETCRDLFDFEGAYLHIMYSGSARFSVALQQHNEQCDETVVPFPETWDSVEAARYSNSDHIYIPLSHFNINKSRVTALAFRGFHTINPTVLYKVEFVWSYPKGFNMPAKLPSGTLVFACSRPNSFAFGIDDGAPQFQQAVVEALTEEVVPVTFFVVGQALLDPSTNLSNFYNDMLKRGHQVALHSYTHPRMESLQSYEEIDFQYKNNIFAIGQMLDIQSKYFRPPYGAEGGRMRQRLAALIPDPYLVNWSIDVEDWIWGQSATPEKQIEAFQRGIDRGGNLVAMHYLYPSTVNYLREFIRLAKATGKTLMRVDQCMEDPDAPPLDVLPWK